MPLDLWCFDLQNKQGFLILSVVLLSRKPVVKLTTVLLMCVAASPAAAMSTSFLRTIPIMPFQVPSPLGAPYLPSMDLVHSVVKLPHFFDGFQDFRHQSPVSVICYLDKEHPGLCYYSEIKSMQVASPFPFIRILNI